MKKRLVLGLTLALCVTGLFACGKNEKETESELVQVEIEAIPTQEEEEVAEETALEDELPEGMYFSELTNLPIDISLQNQRPIAAMVDNEKTALPHFGLNDADIIYELMNSTENDRITRFMVIVKDWGNIEQLGSIRSTRPTNIMLAAEYNAVLCHDGGPYYIDSYFAKDVYKDHFSGIFSRVNNGKAREFTEYIMPGDLESAFESSGYSTEYTEYYQGPHWQFAPKVDPITLEENSDATSCTKIEFPFKHNSSELEYDASDERYYYSEYGSPHLDGSTNEQLAFDNVIIQYCTFSQLDENGYLIFNVLDTSNQPAYYCTKGKCIPCTWVREGTDTSLTHYYKMDGEEITINTGTTYVALVPDDNWDDLSIQ